MTAEAKRHVIVIGASRGIGLGLVEEYLRRGWNVTATSRDLARAPRLGALAEAEPARLFLETVDIAEPDQIEALAHRVSRNSFDVVIVNAGIMGPAEQDADCVSAAAAGLLFYTNAIAPIHVAKRLAHLVKSDAGVIAFMSSRTGSVAAESNGTKPLYRASKAALNSLTRSFVADLKDKAITVLSMHPGWVRTDMGGSNATLDVAASAKGLADVIVARTGTKGHAFVDYAGNEIAW